ncbi:MAG: hypothetical protein LBQ43_01985, partial [Holosporales bacterium]|nr:hypothetical protein [Holosporales bacterium]
INVNLPPNRLIGGASMPKSKMAHTRVNVIGAVRDTVVGINNVIAAGNNVEFTVDDNRGQRRITIDLNQPTLQNIGRPLLLCQPDPHLTKPDAWMRDKTNWRPVVRARYLNIYLPSRSREETNAAEIAARNASGIAAFNATGQPVPVAPANLVAAVSANAIALQQQASNGVNRVTAPPAAPVIAQPKVDYYGRRAAVVPETIFFSK